MTLAEAIEEVKRQSDDVFGKFTEWDLERITRCDEDDDAVLSTAIATILNAVVKGELVAVERGDPKGCNAGGDGEQEWTAGEKKMWFLRNGHNEQAPWEDREDYNMRVYGLREEDNQ